MKLALIGYGKMGKVTEEIALSRKHSIGVIIDNPDDWALKSHLLKECDAAVEFTIPSVAVDNIRKCIEAGVPVVSGTTGWNDKLGEVKDYCLNMNGALLYASNFSLGMNIFFEVNKKLATLMNPYPMYNVSIEEIHHTQKLDAPSGTAITLANEILNSLDRKSNWVNQSSENQDDLVINSVRVGTVPGTHTVTYDSENDLISIRHEAKSRRGLALGAVLAAEFIAGKKGVYTMSDLLGI
jgi:4-hydroxy-tetrahydrodipicolinate reductase